MTQNVLWQTSGYDFSTQISSCWAYINEEVCRAHKCFFVFNNDYGIPIIAQSLNYGDKLLRILRVQADARFI